MKLNVSQKKSPIYTHQVGRASHITPQQQLRRLTMACMLWEDTFYVNGQSITVALEECAKKLDASFILSIATLAKQKGYLRHVPLFLACIALHRKSPGEQIRKNIANLITRPDDITEILAIYWHRGRKPIPWQLRRALQEAYAKFDEYQLAKYNRKAKITLKDVMRMVHPKAPSSEKNELYRKIIDHNLKKPNTWEVRLSRGEDKKQSFETLIDTKRLGLLAALRNLRNMQEAGIPKRKIGEYLVYKSGAVPILPFQFISAFLAAPDLLDYLQEAMLASIHVHHKLKGETAVLVDVSASMSWSNAGKTQMKLVDAACALAILLREVCEECLIYPFSGWVTKVASYRGFALRDAIINSSCANGGTMIGESVRTIAVKTNPDRMVVITDEQSSDRVDPVDCLGYMINIASYKNGVGYHQWNKIDGFSPYAVQYIQEIEGEELI